MLLINVFFSATRAYVSLASKNRIIGNAAKSQVRSAINQPIQFSITDKIMFIQVLRVNIQTV